MQNITRNTGKKVLKWFLIVFTAITLLFTVAGFVISYFYSDKIEKILINELNKNINSKISFEKADFSIFSKFPFASISFKKFLATDATDNEIKDTLLFAEGLYFKFNIIDMLTGKYRLKAIDINNAHIKLNVYEDFSDNYTFWKVSSDTTSTSFELELKKIKFNNVWLTYSYEPYAQLYDFNVIKGELSGKLTDDDFKANIFADIVVNTIKIDSLSFLNQKNASLALELHVNNKTEVYDINRGALCVGRMCFDVTGRIDNKETSVLDLCIRGKDIDLPTFIEELPQQYSEYFSQYQSKGVLDFSATIKGETGSGKVPGIDIKMDLNNGYIKHEKEQTTLENISFNAHFCNGDKRNLSSSFLKFENFKAVLKNGNIEGAFNIDNFNYPQISAEASANFDLNEIVKFSGVDLFENINGNIAFNIKFSGRIKDLGAFTPEDFINSKCHGKGSISRASIKFKDDVKLFSDINSDFQFNNNDVIIEALSFKTGASDFMIKGYLRNVLSFIFIPEQKLAVDAGMYSDKIILHEIFATNSETSSKYNISFPENMTYNFEVDAKHIQFEKFEARNIYGKLKLQNKILYADNVFFEAFDGTVKANALIDGKKNETFYTKAKTQLKSINISKMFEQLNNFRQNELTNKHIKGKLNTDIDILFSFDKELNIDMKSLYAFADIAVDDGELIEYGPVAELSKFIRLSDLSHIKFHTLKNKIEIKDETIHIPNMSIKSNAINIEAMGTHTFNNIIDYRIKLLLSDILGKKAKTAKKENEEFGVVEDDGLGRTTLFLKITGTVDKPVIGYDTKGVYEKNKNAIKEDIKNTINKIGEELFNKPDTVVGLETEKQKEKKKKKKENEIPDGFKIE